MTTPEDIAMAREQAHNACSNAAWWIARGNYTLALSLLDEALTVTRYLDQHQQHIDRIAQEAAT